MRFPPAKKATTARTQTQLNGKKRKASGGESLKIVFEEQVFCEREAKSGVATGGCFALDCTDILKVKIDSNGKEHESGEFIYRNCRTERSFCNYMKINFAEKF